MRIFLSCKHEDLNSHKKLLDILHALHFLLPLVDTCHRAFVPEQANHVLFIQFLKVESLSEKKNSSFLSSL